MKKKYSELVKELAKANKTIKEQKEKLNAASAQELVWPFRLYMAIEGILKLDSSAGSKVKLQLLNQFNESENVEFNAEEVICIVPVAKGRKKIIYLLQNDLLKIYTLNNNNLNLDALCRMIDPLNKFLLKISKSAVINVKHYELAQNQTLHLGLKMRGLKEVRYLKIPGTTKVLSNYIKIRHSIEYNLSLQKRVVGYMI
jgi:hypothetical protein